MRSIYTQVHNSLAFSLWPWTLHPSHIASNESTFQSSQFFWLGKWGGKNKESMTAKRIRKVLQEKKTKRRFPSSVRISKSGVVYFSKQIQNNLTKDKRNASQRRWHIRKSVCSSNPVQKLHVKINNIHWIKIILAIKSMKKI